MWDAKFYILFLINPSVLYSYNSELEQKNSLHLSARWNYNICVLIEEIHGRQRGRKAGRKIGRKGGWKGGWNGGWKEGIHFLHFLGKCLQLETHPLAHLAICFGLAWIHARCPPTPLYHSASSVGQGRGNMMKVSRVKTRTGRDHSPITVTDKTDWTWGEKEGLIYHQSNQSRIVRNKTRS